MDLTFGDVIRLVVIALGLVATWSLWRARDLRSHTWTAKLKEIWLVQIGWALVAIQANIELFYRGVRPTFAIAGVILLLGLSIKAAMRDEPYIKKQRSDIEPKG